MVGPDKYLRDNSIESYDFKFNSPGHLTRASAVASYHPTSKDTLSSDLALQCDAVLTNGF